MRGLVDRHCAVRQLRAPRRQTHRRRRKHLCQRSCLLRRPRAQPIREIFKGNPHNPVIKTPKYAYQKEYRIIGSRPVVCRLLPDENHPGCRIENYTHAELDLSSGLADFSWKASVPSLEEAEDGLMLKLPHRV